LEQFEELWKWTSEQWRTELSTSEQDIFTKLGTETERDLFRILKNFARYAAEKKDPDFPFSLQNVGARLGVSFQHVSTVRRRFVGASIIVQTATAMTNRSAARFRWCIETLDATPRSFIDQ
jgi:hypothetical protein